MINKNIIQDIPVSDSPNNDAFEAIVELYYQLNGFITSSGKWFWYAQKGKQQRGYQDFDVLAINGQETVIVSVSSNLDNKLSFKRSGEINEEQLTHLKAFFDRSEEYLKTVHEYKWIIGQKREIKRVVAYLGAQKRRLEDIRNCLIKNSIDLLASDKIVKFILIYLENNKNLKVQDQTLRMLQVLKHNEMF